MVCCFRHVWQSMPVKLGRNGVSIAMHVLLAFALLSLPTLAFAEEKEPPSSSKGEKVQVAVFLKQYCLRCHGPQKQEGDFALHKLDGKSVKDLPVEVWKMVYDQLVSGNMPPEDAKKPLPGQRKQALLSIEQALVDAGVSIDKEQWLDPSRGNWVDHDLLFSGKATTTPATRGRLWRLTGQAYEEFVQSLNLKYRLGFRTYGHHRVRSPWELAPRKGFRDYATEHRIGEPEIEHHLRNATRVARAMVVRLPKSREPSVQNLKTLLKAGKTADTDQVDTAAADAFLGILGRRARVDEQKRYAAFLKKNLDILPPERAIEQLLIAILFHPEAMYRIELPEAGVERSLMPPRDLARAIAYALTDREPDEKLQQAVAEGKLTSREAVHAQIERILSDREIAMPSILRFFQEYFGYTKAIEIFKDEATRKAAGFRGRNDWHPNFFVSDTDRLVAWILEADKNVLNELLTTNKTFAVTGETKQALGIKRYPDKPFSLFAQTVLNIYEIDIPRKDWSEERPFPMPAEHRVGILTHPSWLIAHSTNFDNHAILRGRWIRERLLGGKIPEIPVTVDAQLPDRPDLTLRERMQVTRQDYCWKCHQQMDPLGLPLENYDHFGRYRTVEQVVDKEATEKNVDKNGRFRGIKYTTARLDTSGNVHQSGDSRLDGPVKDPREMIRKLASSKRVEQVFVRHAFRYFLGRNETLADAKTLIEAHRAYADNEGSMNALITSLLTSDAFLYRTDSGTDTDEPEQGTKRKQP